MDFNDTPEEAAFRAEARAWLDANAEVRAPDDPPADVLGERSDPQIIKAAQVDGIPNWRIYSAIIIPSMAPIFLSAFIVLAHLAIKSYDLVIALTNGGPGRATEVPATFMYSYTFTRNQMGVGASSAVIMLIMIASIIVPYLYSELRQGRK